MRALRLPRTLRERPKLSLSPMQHLPCFQPKPAVRCAVAAVLTGASLLFGSGGAAAQATAHLQVTAVILRHADMTLVASPPALTITQADVDRGYVDTRSPARIAVRENTGGFVLVFDSAPEFARGITVRGMGPDVQMGGNGGLVTYRTHGRGMATSMLDLNFRFELAPKVPPGTYGLPVRMSVMPL